jgi:hypothetical protein
VTSARSGTREKGERSVTASGQYVTLANADGACYFTDIPTLEASMTERQVLANQKTIIANQTKILANQKTIVANQRKLDRVLANQKTIEGNQKKILVNQAKILAAAQSK